MQFMATKIHGAYIIDIERREDHCGFFARSWCQKEFEAHGLTTSFVQTNIGFSEIHREPCVACIFKRVPTRK
jgi:dTDP-4-dehydrorhamnose 3,5-epimerase